MAKRIKKLKQKISENEFSDYIPIGADARNVDLEDGDTLEQGLTKIKQSISALETSITEQISTALEQISDDLEALQTKVEEDISPSIDTINGQITSLQTAVSTTIPNQLSTINTNISNLETTISDMDDTNNARFEAIENNMQQLITYKTVTISTSNWVLNNETQLYENEILDETIPSGALIQGYLDLSNQAKILNGYIESFSGGFKVITATLPQQNIQLNITIQVVATTNTHIVGAINITGLGWYQN